MKNASLIFVLSLLLLPALSRAGDAPSYEMHEWGVFPVPRNAAWANIDMRAEISSMPKFFWKMWPEQHLPWRGGVNKPVIYFYCDKPLSVNVKIRFADGRPLVWWPAAEKPAGGIGNVRPDELEFSLRVGHYAPPDSWMHKNLKDYNEQQLAAFEENYKKIKPPEVEKGHWMEALRVPASSMLYTQGSYTNRRVDNDNQPVEKFIYYDGVMKAPETPQLDRDGENLVMKSKFAYAISDLFVIDRSATRTRISKAFVNIQAGEQTAKIEMIAAGDGKGDAKTIDLLAEEFVKRLVAAGLTQDEAVGLEKVWHPGLFLHDGVSILYRVPQDIYDQWLPLTAKPAPKKTVRVGLVLHQHLEPELEANVNALIKKLSAEDFADRQQAMQSLMNTGGAAFPYLEAAIKNKDTELETANNCRKVMDTLDARPSMQQKKAE